MRSLVRWMHRLALPVMGVPLAALASTGCQDDPYCYTCNSDGSSGASGSSGSSGSSGNSGVDLDGSLAFDVQISDGGGIPACGNVTTRENCGTCGNRCEREGANSSCELQDGKYACVYTCAAGLIDINQDLYSPSSNGCEYACVPNGAEKCDRIDNDCNGKVDDGLANDTDPNNCGACGTRCAYKNANALCVAGECQIGSCAGSFVDLDKNASNGCEYQCTLTNGGVEKCDELDNDCNGQKDDMAAEALATDLRNCGGCGISCVGTMANAVPECASGRCVLKKCEPGFFDGNNNISDGCEQTCDCPKVPFTEPPCNDRGECSAPKCLPDYHDLNGDLSKGAEGDGCEYNCTVTNGGVEICDNLDNDCNNKVDDNPLVATDPLNCGGCGQSCLGKYPNSTPTCESNACVMKCLPGFFDKNNTPGDGCEFRCSDCHFPDAEPNAAACLTQGACVLGQCSENSWNLDGNDSNGCEYKCIPAGGVQDATKSVPESTCNNVDDDCDGVIDEGFSLTTDANNCGACGLTCQLVFPNAVGICQPDGTGTGTCKPGACAAGFVDTDNNPTNGCECQLNNGGVEICNGRDDNCDGQIDNGITSLPADTCTSYQASSCGGTPACVGGQTTCQITKTAEICDGLDNNCDGTVDENPSLLPGVGQLCGAATTPEVGSCHKGHQVCTAGALVCVGEVKPAAVETCNGIDDNCNGQIDESTALNPIQGLGTSCGSGVVRGACHRGTYTSCVGGSLVCTGEVLPGTEVCNGIDDDCDGSVDESTVAQPLPGLGDRCGTVVEIGECKKGTYTACTGGALVCSGVISPTPEVCDGKDNDCNGIADENIASLPTACSSYKNTKCGGTTRCEAGIPVCHYTSSQEICDGLDNDCDEQVDETSAQDPLPGLGELCGTAPQVGECKLGTYSACTNGALVCTGEIGKTAETCDGKDNNCDGKVDETPVTVTNKCTAYQTASCSCTTRCVSGVSTASMVSSQEVCDGKDNDCDGQTDELPLAEIGQSCGSGSQLGECHLGNYSACTNGALVCTGQVTATAETCDGKDNDCDGVIDDNPTGGAGVANGLACPPTGFSSTTGLPGICKAGTWACSQYYNAGNLAGRWECRNAVNPGVEVCNNPALDENCNGTSNEHCLRVPNAAFRMDTGGGSITTSNQNQHSSFQVSAVSEGEVYGAAYGDLRNHKTNTDDTTDYAQPRIFGRFSVDGGATWQAEQSFPPLPAVVANQGNTVWVFDANNNNGNDGRGGKNWSNVADLAAAGGQAMRAQSDTGTTVDTNVNTNSPRLQFQVNFPNAGTYYVWVRGRGDANGDSCHIGIENNVSSSDVGTFRRTYSWVNTTESGARVTVSPTSAGNARVSLWMREDGLWVDGIIVTSDANFVPPNTSSFAQLPEGGRVEPNLFMHSGRAYVAFSEFMTRTAAGRVRRIFVASADRGAASPNFANWSSPIRLDDADLVETDGTVDGINRNLDFYRPQGVVAKVGATPNQDLLAVAWSSVDGTVASTPTRNVYVAYSLTGGRTWSVPLRVNSVVDKAEMPAITSDSQGMVSVAWRQTSGTPARERVMVRRLDLTQPTPALGTEMFLEADVAGQSSDDVGIAADTVGNLHVVWTDVDGTAIRVATGEACGVGFTDVQCLASFNIGGAVLNTDGQALNAVVARPNIAVRDGEAVVAWEDARSGYSDIRLNRAIQSANWAWPATSQRADGDGLGAAMSMNPRVAFGESNRVVVTWEDTRDDTNLSDGLTTSIYANDSIDDGVTFFTGTGAYALRLDTGANGNSLTPYVLTNPARAASAGTSVVWLDYVTSTGANGQNGDIYARQLTE